MYEEWASISKDSSQCKKYELSASDVKYAAAMALCRKQFLSDIQFGRYTYIDKLDYETNWKAWQTVVGRQECDKALLISSTNP